VVKKPASVSAALFTGRYSTISVILNEIELSSLTFKSTPKRKSGSALRSAYYEQRTCENPIGLANGTMSAAFGHATS
jgi:hypothetical protein